MTALLSADFTEQAFFLKAFHGTTLALAVSTESDLEPRALAALREVLGLLQGHGVRVLLFCQRHPGVRGALEGALGPLNPPPHRHLLGEGEAGEGDALVALWRERTPLLVVEVAAAPGVREFLGRVARLAVVLRLSRLVITHAAGGVPAAQGSGVASYLSARRLAVLLAARKTRPAGRRWLWRIIHSLLVGGVEAVSLCRLEELPQELFTYEGRGTFFSQRHYCTVRRLGFNHFHEVESIIRRGEREGYLAPRDDRQLLRVLTSGYGAFIADRYLAGVCGLLREPYRQERAGEVVSLYTITRYLGEGVGGHLLQKVRREARHLGLGFLFACTTNQVAVNFFQRHGFQPVGPEGVPAAKWVGYDPARRERVRCLRLDLEE